MDEQMKKRIEDMIGSKKVFVFIKGTPQEPQCGFTVRVCSILQDLKVDFGTFNVLSDFPLLETLREYSNWPTTPQLYVDGKFVGGCDIVEEMHKSGELKKVIDA